MARDFDAAPQDSLISIIAPVYNEAEVIEAFQQRLGAVLHALPQRFEIIYVNDGSSDDSLEKLESLRKHDERIAIVDLSRNFGKEIAMSAGLDHARGDAAIIIDTDLQDPPELIPDLIHEWLNGYEVVYAKRLSRRGESVTKKLTAHGFYRIMQRIGHLNIPEDTGDFRLLDRRAIDAVNLLRERHRFMKGLFSWIGYRQKAVPYHRDPRHRGTSKWNYWRLWNFALEGITSFTTVPLRLATYVGVITAAAAFLFGLFIIYDTLVHGNPVPGYPSLMVVVLFLGGVQLISIGIIGEYLGRMFEETKRRPLYLINSYEPAATSTRAAANDAGTGDRSSGEE